MNQNETEDHRLWLLSDGTLTQEERVKEYDEYSEKYEEVFKAENYQAPLVCAETVGRYITREREKVNILDIGCGTGWVAECLIDLGFRKIDGIDMSQGMIDKAKKKNIYRKLECQLFTSQQSNIETDTYDALCIVGAFGKGDISEDAVNEMIRIGKPGCVMCFVGRTVAFELLLPYLVKLESENLLRKEEITETDRYRDSVPGLVVVYRVV